MSDGGGTIYDDPNRQAVGLDPAWVEGDGGLPVDPKTGGDNGTTKAELLERARELGVTPANNDMTKAELQAGIDAKLAEG